MEILTTFAEISVAIGGFASLFVVLKDKLEGDWNKHIFSGLVGHAFVAFAFSLFPFLVKAFTTDIQLLWIICSIPLGIWNIVQGILIVIYDKKSSKPIIYFTLITSLITGGITLFNGLGIYFDYSMDAYLVGIIWHLFQGMLIFSMLMMSPIEND